MQLNERNAAIERENAKMKNILKELLINGSIYDDEIRDQVCEMFTDSSELASQSLDTERKPKMFSATVKYEKTINFLADPSECDAIAQEECCYMLRKATIADCNISIKPIEQ